MAAGLGQFEKGGTGYRRNETWGKGKKSDL